MFFGAPASSRKKASRVPAFTICATPLCATACWLGIERAVNPQSRLPYLATYLGHKDINSTLVYLTITQELLQHASERFRQYGAFAVCELRREAQRMTDVPFPQLLHAFFHYWLVEQRNASHHTVLSYRDTWRLFLRHAAAAKK